jgi:spore coat polysaccharide biosynthesis protein SpsF (cytidylyltransferase family)
MTAMPVDKSIELKIGASDAVLAQQQELNDNIAMLVANQAAAFRRGEETSVLQRIHVNVSDADAADVALIDGDIDAD